MALDPSTRYAGQIAADANYPYGKARNVAVSGDGSGTPLEADLVNDIFGFEQALLDAVGATPSGSPDQVGASQYLDAVNSLITDAADSAQSDAEATAAAALADAVAQRHAARYTLSGSGIAQAAKYALTLAERSNTGYALASDEITVPEAGWYSIALTLALANSDTNDPTPITVSVMAGAVDVADGFANRFTASAGEAVGVSASAIVSISNPSTQKIKVIEATGTGTGTVAVRQNALSITRVA